jgi:hypothetical protein
MFFKISILVLILMSLTISVQAQNQSVQIVCQPGVNADSVKVQYSISPTFATILGQSPYKVVVVGKTDTCDCSVPAVQGTIYYFRCYSWNPVSICIASPQSVTIPRQPISGCATVSVKLIP